ncbi:ribose/xylose/arabinose/galactoside ABC-type transport system permease subunit [Luteibacter jiangsuensis]|uniref:Autoinducer 2 import system permease protein LsrC n=1 Tax=Luteibacter jiangsuensis TaxID=637577 RepID=A0ABT9SW27_9GAMM|nr:ABC transporter permease [Luteibacter jiangsuensis]MDQ0009197.1 ribose/xylose/arabinose/galactoside ABC-type transport system permease subunit [Luteibacter jiangsuensis]
MNTATISTYKRMASPRFAMTREATLVVATVGLTLAVGILNHDFLGAQNLRFMLLNSVVLSLVALGQTLVISMRGIDLSVAPVLGLSAMVCGLLAQTHGLSLSLALPLAVGMGMVLGSVNGVLVAALDIPPIVVTLGTYSLYSGLTFLYSDGTQVDAVPAAWAAFGNGNLLGAIPLPTPAIVLMVVLALCWYMLRHTAFGRAILAVGNNATAAYAAGLPVAWVRVRVYALAGMLAAFSGLMFLCYTGSATVTAGTGDHIELQSIAVSLIGGTAIAGGRGNLIGTVLGSLFLSVVLTALVFLHVPPIWYSAGEGLMILAAVQGAFRRRGAQA